MRNTKSVPSKTMLYATMSDLQGVGLEALVDANTGTRVLAVFLEGQLLTPAHYARLGTILFPAGFSIEEG